MSSGREYNRSCLGSIDLSDVINAPVIMHAFTSVEAEFNRKSQPTPGDTMSIYRVAKIRAEEVRDRVAGYGG